MQFEIQILLYGSEMKIKSIRCFFEFNLYKSGTHQFTNRSDSAMSRVML